MALVGSIMMGVYRNPVGAGSVLKVVQGGSSTIATYENKVDTTSLGPCTKMGFVWDGQVYIAGSSWRSSNYGFLSYNPTLSAMDWQSFLMTNVSFTKGMQVGKYLLLSDNSGLWRRFTSPIYTNDLPMGSLATQPIDHIVCGNSVYWTNQSTTAVASYPFTSTPSTVPGIVDRLATLNGEVYGLDVVAGLCTVKKYVSGTWQTVTTLTPTESARVQATNPTNASFFGFNGLLWALFCYNNGGLGAAQWVSCYSIDPATGTVVDQNALVPAAWKVAPTHSNCMLFEVIDDTQATEQIFIVRCGNWNSGVWEMYEFSDAGIWTLVWSGADYIFPYCGVVYNEASYGTLIESVSDSHPSSYATAVIRTSDMAGNAAINIDPRYNDMITPSAPPHAVCTDKGPGVGSEGKVALATKPAGITVLADLSDNFDDSVIDPDLWEPCNPAYDEAVNGYDYGLGAFSGGIAWYDLKETMGRIAFGGTLPLPPLFVAHTGVGIVSKWDICDDFQVDVTIAGIANIAPSASKAYRIFIKIFESTNYCYGIQVWNDSGTYKVNGFTFAINTPEAANNLSASFVTVEGKVLRISRVAGVWSMFHDPTGSNDDLLPVIQPVSAGTVRILIGACTRSAANFASGTPGPGFSDITVSDLGVGTLGLYIGSVKHNFMWDHVTDLGAGFVGSAQMFVDSD